MKLRLRLTVSAGLTLMLASGLFAQQATSDTPGDAGSTLSNANAGKKSWGRQAEDFVPMTRSERAAHYAYSVFGPQAFLNSAVQAGFNQLRDTPEEWRQGGE